MAGRLPPPLPKLGRPWSTKIGWELERFLRHIWFAMSGLQSPPSTPTSIEAGTAAAKGTSQAPALADHRHAVDETGDVQEIAISAADGTGTGIARKTHVHDTPLTTNGDLLTVVGGALVRLAIGSEGQRLVVESALPVWKHGVTDKSWTFTSPAGSSGTFYYGGYYFFASTDNDFSGGPTFGTANASYAAHFMIVLGAVTVDELTIRVTGTSITDAGVRTAADTEDIVVPNSTAIDTYFETVKKWLGQVTITIVSGTATTCNYGFCKYWDFSNSDFTVTAVEATWLGGANDANPDIQLLHHNATGWTFNAGAEPTPPTPIATMDGDHSTESQVVNGENGAWKRTGLSVDVDGAGSEGTIIKIITTSNKAFELGNVILSITPR